MVYRSVCCLPHLLFTKLIVRSMDGHRERGPIGKMKNRIFPLSRKSERTPNGLGGTFLVLVVLGLRLIFAPSSLQKPFAKDFKNSRFLSNSPPRLLNYEFTLAGPKTKGGSRNWLKGSQRKKYYGRERPVHLCTGRPSAEAGTFFA